MTDQVTTRRVVLSVGVGTGLLCLVLAALAMLALVAVTALHFVPSSSSAKPKIFPRLNSTPLGIPAASIDHADPVEAFGPVDRSKLNEPKSIAPPPPPPPPAELGDEIIDEPKTAEEVKSGDCPNCPPSVGLRVVPRSPSPVYPSYPPPGYPAPSYRYPPSYPGPSYSQPTAGGSWIQTQAGPVWLPSGYAFEHDTGLLRNLATGQRSRPSSQTSRPAPLEPYRVPRLPEQPPLADDGLGKWPALAPAVPDFTKSPRGERKTGGYACANCRRPTVGDQWATQWTAEGTPISFLCRECWEKMTPDQRQAAYVAWYRRATE